LGSLIQTGTNTPAIFKDWWIFSPRLRHRLLATLCGVTLLNSILFTHLLELRCLLFHRRPHGGIDLIFLQKFFEVSFLRSIWQKL
jgi:hypothetical protein